jgi:hypothetical protein
MRARTVTVLLTAAILTAFSFPPASVQAQTEPARPAVQQVEIKPIGRIVTATGSVTVEHAGAVVVQASVGKADQAKVGDLVYLGDVVLTGADGKCGINFADGSSFNLSTNARIVLDEFVYDPNGKSNSTLFTLSKGTFTFVAGGIRQDRRYEGRHPRRHHGHSRHDAARRDFRGWVGQVRDPDRRG